VNAFFAQLSVGAGRKIASGQASPGVPMLNSSFPPVDRACVIIDAHTRRRMLE
jgi:hypothetical protein